MRPTPLKSWQLGAVLSAFLLAAACNSNVKVHEYTYYCASNADCVQGFTCIANVCSDGTVSSADAKSGTDTASSSDTAASKDGEEAAKCSSSDVACLTDCGINKCPVLLYKCNEDKDCKAAIYCYAACTTTPCRVKCLNNASPASQAAMNALQDCLVKKCM